MTATKEEKYLQISKEIADYVGGENNILGVAHCATRLRIVVEDQAKVDMKKIETVALVKGAFVTGDQIQIIFGAGLVNEVYEVFAKYTHKENMTFCFCCCMCTRWCRFRVFDSKMERRKK